MGKTRYDFDVKIDELLDEALNVLSNREYEKLLDDISIMLAERDVKFNPLWSPSEQEQIALDQQKAGAELTRAKVAQVYTDMGVLDPSEVRKKLATSRTEETMSEFDGDWIEDECCENCKHWDEQHKECCADNPGSKECFESRFADENYWDIFNAMMSNGGGNVIPGE